LFVPGTSVADVDADRVIKADLTMLKKYLLVLLLLSFACQGRVKFRSDPESQQKHLALLYTNDEHGWMERTADYAGAAGLAASWKELAGSTNNHRQYLILSGGDMWTGPAISTLTTGRSMVDVMNALGYQAAALGNHEFDFGLENLRNRVSEMHFPLLAANVIYKSNGQQPDFVKPYMLIDINDVSVGIIGLASVITPLTTNSKIVADLAFTGYAEALQKFVPRVRAEGAELLIVIGHICLDEMIALAPLASELGIKLIGGGHCHELCQEQIAGVQLIQSGSDWQHFIQVDILFDDLADTVISLTSHTYPNTSTLSDTTIAGLVSAWREELDLTLKEVIGFTKTEIPERSPEMHNMITDSWLNAYPDADIALTNTGGIRQSIPAGNITIETIYGLLPFQNNILELVLSGDQVINCLKPSIIAAGLSSIAQRLLTDGRPICADSTYHVLINDFMYTQPAMNFRSYDQHPYDLQVNYRQPLIDWLKAIKTTKINPLNNFLDPRVR
jgi:5'-nucleotidase/UDP-sugar diphosphatase